MNSPIVAGAANGNPAARPGGSRRAIAIDIVLNVVLPYAAYVLLKRAGQSDARSLILSAVVPAAVALVSLVQRRRMNGLSLLVIFATALSLGATALSGSAWFALIRPSFVTGSIALAFMASLTLKRPALFYLARDTTCPTPEEARAFEAQWASAIFRRSMRRLTVVWAVFLGGEAALRAGLAAIWPDATLVAATQILWVILPILLTRWSIRAGRRWAAQEAE
ncbi:VC0807 family protein [Lichenicoccus sp.]|uniref:VC0807 family protein n=1 Tax=Lichenicoccus sp. TaxID=2781899 RepID=UPI003D12E7AB